MRARLPLLLYSWKELTIEASIFLAKKRSDKELKNKVLPQAMAEPDAHSPGDALARMEITKPATTNGILHIFAAIHFSIRGFL